MLPETFNIEFVSADTGAVQRIFVSAVDGDKNHQPITQLAQIMAILFFISILTEPVQIKLVVTASPL